NIVLNTEQSYALSDLALAATNSNEDLIYIEQVIDEKRVSIAVNRQKFLEGLSGFSNTKFIVRGGATWSGTGLVYDLSQITFNYFGNEGVVAPTQITLDDGDSQPRFDVIVVDVDTATEPPTGTISVVKGTPDGSPLVPSVSETQIPLQAVLIAAGASEPTVTQDFTYRNDDEWATSTYAVGSPQLGTVDFQSTDNPFEGTFCIESNTSRTTGLRFQRTGLISLDTYTSLSFRIKFDTELPANRNLLSSVWNNSSSVGNTVNLSDYGIDRTLTGVWQQVVVPTSAFNASSIDRIQIRMDGGTNLEQVEYFLDYIVFSTGAIQPSAPTIITFQDSGVSVGSRPKLNFIPGQNITLNVVDDP
ncbi:MAG: hypothetical protein LC664_12880, partial [Flavobacteriales bacterium]|nr:hypothetical protein [Flavobacteriales bacterium]